MTCWGKRDFYSTLRKLDQDRFAGCFQNILKEYLKTRIGKKPKTTTTTTD
ncbi:mCG147271 [Mus musculus]|jgi:hypothetical protein|nr:mCG147271 [Mus musculus]